MHSYAAPQLSFTRFGETVNSLTRSSGSLAVEVMVTIESMAHEHNARVGLKLAK